ncbi:MAG TPA: M28 family peptidase, partial [Bacteroidota bacterium]|nr:M28 family peptidase [Bacteroidota bacterium]
STLVFCCFGGEEQGLVGSEYFVDHFSDIDSVRLMLQIDMANGLGIIDIDPDTYGRSAPRWLVSAAVDEFYKLGYEGLRYPTHFFSLNYSMPTGSGSDHEPFLKKGIPALDFSTDVSNPIHTPRDNFDNFDPRGMKRSGDLVVKLVERFDGGTPNNQTEQYWLYLLGKTPIFISHPILWFFLGTTIIIAIIAIIAVRRRRKLLDSPEYVRWSGVKMFFFSVIIVTCGWLSSDLIALIKGDRYPWFSAITEYYILATVALFIGAWISLALSNKLRLTQCPYVFFKRSIIILVIFIICLAFLNIEITVAPVVALLLISLAMLVKLPVLRIIFVALSPWWMLRLIFSEWDTLIFRSAAMALPSGAFIGIAFNGIVILFFALYILPFLLALASVYRDTNLFKPFISLMRSRRVILIATISFVGVSGYLSTIPSYNKFWYREVRIDQRYDMKNETKEVTLKSPEYLSNLHINHGGKDTIINTRSTFENIVPDVSFDSTWLSLHRTEKQQHFGDTTKYEIELTLAAKHRPYRILVSYSSGEQGLNSFYTPWKFIVKDNENQIHWYSFPDSILIIPLKFQMIGADSIKEQVEVTFDGLAYPMTFDRELTYFIQRTKYQNEYIYNRR